MVKLLVKTTETPNAPEAWIGGQPLAPPEMPWPCCRSCEGPMQFFAQLPLGEAGAEQERWLLLFGCMNEPGMCDEWDAESGGNAALLVPCRDASARLEVPEPCAGDPLRPNYIPLACEALADGELEQTAYQAALSQRGGEVLGKLGGEPRWMEDEDPPLCACGEAMRFVAQLEEGSELIFGGGWGLAFICGACRDQARFLWQQ